MKKKPAFIYLLRDGMSYHTRAFIDHRMADDECDEFEKVTGRRPEIVMRTVNDHHIGRNLLYVERFQQSIVDGKTDIQFHDEHSTFFTIAELRKGSEFYREIHQLIDDRKDLDFMESFTPGDEYVHIIGPYKRTYNDVGEITVLGTKYTVRRIRIIKGN